MKYLIVGGVAGGASTAARLRRLDENAEIIMFERGEYISYANCGLPYYIGELIYEREKLFVQTPESFAARFNIEARVCSEVERVDTGKKVITVRDLASGRVYEEAYDKLVLSPGAAPVRPPLEGIDTEGIFTLRNVNDTDRVKEYIEDHDVKRALIVGAGFIGLEMAENLHEYGIKVSVVEMADQVMTPVDYEIASVVHQHFKSKGVGLHLQEAVTAFRPVEGGIDVVLRSGLVTRVDMVLLSIGVRPDVKLAREAGLEIGETGGIKVNEYMQTSHPDVYAVGDAVEFPNPVSGRPALAFLAGPANKQGRICADNVACGNHQKYKGSINTAIAKVFDLTVGAAGLSAKMLDRLQIPYREAIVHGASHAGYYPGAVMMDIKINFSPEDGRLLGAQAVGVDGVDKRLEMMSAVIRGGGTIYDLMELEQAYAPPYSSAKDPVNMAGFVADNMLSGKVKVMSWRELRATDRSGVMLVDVRSAEEFAMGSIEGAVNIPLDGSRAEFRNLPKDRTIVVFCAIGLRGYIAARVLMQLGYEVVNLNGGYRTYATAMAEQGNPLKYAEPEKPVEVKAPGKVEEKKSIAIDACGLQCPGPVLKLKSGMEQLQAGERLEIKVTDQGFSRDVASWAKMTGNQLVDVKEEKGIITAILEKGGGACPVAGGKPSNNKTLIVFSDDLDKALASFVIANGAASTGRKVTMFFTFWGLNVIKKERPGAVKKDAMGKMFGMMLPSGSRELSLSKMNMMGIGSRMMRKIMRDKRIDSLESLIEQAKANGVEFIACQMSMDVMGITREELIDGVNVGGVATYLERAEEANVNLFV
ncbi:DsrE/DsrF/DrsH-like family protein [Odoribacter sp. AF15-53]|uniref:DsrE/DsrF/DrsH-like family protein n=1 Tax=Odoribacter sp. AF15-53 TaxID=2292236 RepID=UPI000E467E6A|nr:DsrE/DsrF/DrsH-like family protein [Odoribacter sp. AF15-53]RHR79142.1 pyridine nucleotide-disulfide oxidoreductase [Odoribacter sp. AF15-53]